MGEIIFIKSQVNPKVAAFVRGLKAALLGGLRDGEEILKIVEKSLDTAGYAIVQKGTDHEKPVSAIDLKAGFEAVKKNR